MIRRRPLLKSKFRGLEWKRKYRKMSDPTERKTRIIYRELFKTDLKVIEGTLAKTTMDTYGVTDPWPESEIDTIDKVNRATFSLLCAAFSSDPGKYAEAADRWPRFGKALEDALAMLDDRRMEQYRICLKVQEIYEMLGGKSASFFSIEEQLTFIRGS
jgi:hypothetical protein